MQERGVCAARENSSTFAPIVSMLVAFASAGTKTVCVPGARASRLLLQHSPWIGMGDTDGVRRFKLTYLLRLRASA
jgi:hypothetical protein